MNKLALTIAALAALATAALAEGNHDFNGYFESFKGEAKVESRAVYANEETSAEGMSSSEHFKQGGRDGHSGRGGAN